MLNPFEAKILTILIKNPTFLNTTEVSKGAKISWNTAEKYLDEMHQRGWLEKKGRTKFFWKAILPEDEDED